MRIRGSLLLTLAPVFIVIGFAQAGTKTSEKPKSGVSLMLAKVSAERRPSDTLFRCEIGLDNETGEELSVQSNFTTAFDGLELVVTTVDGATLVQQSYAFHQSPFLEPREFTLKKGVTSTTLGFPIQDFASDAQEVKVRLVGTLPGSRYRRILSTETISVKVSPES